MKWIVRMMGALMLISLGILIALGLWHLHSPQPQPAPSPRLTIEQIQPLAELVVLNLEVADVVECRIDGHVGGVRGALIVQGDVQLATDLSQARFESVDEQTRTAVLVLPPPKTRHPRVNHEKTRLYSVGTHGLWMLVPDDKADRALLNRLYADAQQSLARAATASELDQRARAHAERVLSQFLASLGWHITLRWSDRP